MSQIWATCSFGFVILFPFALERGLHEPFLLLSRHGLSQGFILLAWFPFDPSMVKLSHDHYT